MDMYIDGYVYGVRMIYGVDGYTEQSDIYGVRWIYGIRWIYGVRVMK